MKKRKWKLLITVMLIFVLSAQPVLAANGARLLLVGGEDAESVSENGEAVSENELH